MTKWLEHRAKDLVFGLFRLFFRKGRRDLTTLDATRMSKVLFLRPEKIGDMVISLPTFDALHARFPHLKISVLASPRNVALIKDDPRFDKIFLYRKWSWEDFRQLSRIRREHFDCVIDMIDNDSVTALFFSQLVGRKAIRIGVGKTRHGIFYDFIHVHADGIGEHIVDNTLKLLAPFGIDGSGASGFAPPYIPQDAQQRIDAFLNEKTNKRTLVGFNLSAGLPNRIWPDNKGIDLCRRLEAWRGDLQVIVIAVPADRRRAEAVVAEIGGTARLVPPNLSLVEVSALIARLNLLISPDTSLIHIARSFNIPVVGLYNLATKNFRRWRPFRQPDGAVLGSDIDTIADITVEQVLERIQQVLERVEKETA
jgi:ADP-heptose:LPS heptosyltransferase